MNLLTYIRNLFRRKPAPDPLADFPEFQRLDVPRPVGIWRVCKKCRRSKLIEHFAFSGYSPGHTKHYRRAVCKSCQAEMRRERKEQA